MQHPRELAAHARGDVAREVRENRAQNRNRQRHENRVQPVIAHVEVQRTTDVVEREGQVDRVLAHKRDQGERRQRQHDGDGCEDARNVGERVAYPPLRRISKGA